MTYLPAVELELMAAMERATTAAPGTVTSKPHRAARWRRPRRLGLALAVGVLGLAGIAGAVAVLPTGDPVGPTSPLAIPGSERLAGLAIPDPVGGPPWDLQFFTNRDGLSCAQVGRNAEGRFGVLGADGALHPMPPGSGPAWGCGGRPGDSLDVGGYVSTAIAGATAAQSPCDIAGDEPCDEDASRVFVFGVLGSGARSLSYTAPDGATTDVPLGRHGTFLLVRQGRDLIRGTLTATWNDGHTTSGSAAIGADGQAPFVGKP